MLYQILFTPTPRAEVIWKWFLAGLALVFLFALGRGPAHADQPLANAGADQTYAEGFLVGLDGGQSSGNNLLYTWRQISGPIVPLDLTYSQRPVALFETPEVSRPTTLVFELRVTDSVSGQSNTDLVTITVVEPAANRYFVVDAGGPAGGGAGTAADPFRRQTIQAAIDANLQPGDVVYIRPGTYRPPLGTPPNGNSNNRVARRIAAPYVQGTPTAPIIFAKYPGATGDVILDGDPRDPNYPGFTGFATAWEMFNAQWVKVSNIKIQKFKAAGIAFRATSEGAAHHVTLDGIEVQDKHETSTTWEPGIKTEGPVRFVLVSNSAVHDYSGGIIFWDHPAQNDRTAHVPPEAGNTAPGSPAGGYASDMAESAWDAWPGWTQFAARWSMIRDSLAYRNVSASSPGNSDNFETRYAMDSVIKNNVAFDCSDDNFDLMGGTRLEMYGNIAFDCQGAGDGNGVKVGVRGGLDNIVYRNISFNNKRSGFDMADTERARVFNNTVYNHQDNFSYGLWFEAIRADDDGAVVVNNLVIASDPSDIGSGRQVSVLENDYNALSDNATGSFAMPLVPATTHTLLNLDNVFADPGRPIDTSFPSTWSVAERLVSIRSQVAAKLSLAADSPAVDAGRLVAGITDNFAGSAPDIGAYESAGSRPPVQPPPGRRQEREHNDGFGVETVTCTNGDLNGDLAVDDLDVDLFVAVLAGVDTDPVHVCAADVNDDGAVDNFDVAPFQRLLRN